MIRTLNRVPYPARYLGAHFLEALPQGAWRAVSRAAPGHSPRLLGDKVHKIALLMQQRSTADMYRSLLSVWKEPESFLRAPSAKADGSAPPGWDDVDLMRSMMLLDQRYYLPDDLLAKLDRASMAVGLEARSPLLDYRIIEMSRLLNPSMLAERGIGKQLLRRILYRYVPRELIERPKMGFSVPVAQWLGGPLREMAGDMLGEREVLRHGVLNPVTVGRAWTRFLRGDTRDALGLWSLVVFQAWCGRWLRANEPVSFSTASFANS
jgi:asparagine synthase (glutamine-hydrolysing)